MSVEDGARDRVREELAREQAHIDRAYAALDRLREGADTAGPDALGEDEGAGGTFQERFERERALADARRRVGELRWGDPPLVFGRIDPSDDGGAPEQLHIGRIGVFDEDQEQLVVDWRAPIAEGFYRATRSQPMGLTRRRSFHCRGRRLLGIDDVVLDGGGRVQDVDVVGEAALLAALSSPRTDRMHDVVATVQSEQDEVIRAPMAGITIVQGAAGTGKTVVALHRAAYLLYTFRDVLDRQGVLVLGPNARFLDYVRDVLPSLGEHDARLATVGDLFPGVRPRPEAPEVAVVKADLRMARLVRRAVAMRQRRVRCRCDIPVGRYVLKLEAEAVNAVVDDVKGLVGTHNERRRFIRRGLESLLYEQFRRRNTAPTDRMRDPGRAGFAARLARTPAFEELLDRLWPLLTAPTLLYDLYGSRAMLRHGGRDGLLDEGEQDLLHRPPDRRDEATSWTVADVPLLHEAHALLGPLPRPQGPSTEPTEDEQLILDRVIDGVRRATELGLDAVMEADLRRSILEEVRIDAGTGADEAGAARDGDDIPDVWGSVLVDEAQDVSPMAWRMIARACPNQAMTIVGDLAQGTEPWSPDSWDEVVEWIGARRPARRHELHINYRTPIEIMAWASPFSARPDRVQAVRSSGMAPRAVQVDADDRVRVAAAEATELRRALGAGRIAAIAHPRTIDDLLDHVEDDVELHTPESVKGLEFDGVVVVEPAAMVVDHGGTAPLYIALTRATRALVVVHALALPEPLGELAGRPQLVAP